MTPEEAKRELDAIDATLKKINDAVNSAVGNILLNAIPFVKDVLKFVHDRIADISHTIERIVREMTTTVSNAIGSLLPSAVDFLTGIANDIFNDVHNILGNLATAEEFVGGAIGEIKRHAGPAASFAIDALGGGLVSGIVGALQLLEKQDAATVDHFLDQILDAKSKPPWLDHMVKGLRGRGAEWQALALPLLVGVLLQPIGEAMVNPLLIELRQQSNSIFKTEVLSPPVLVEARLKGVITLQQFYDGMAYNNFDRDRADEMYNAQFAPMETQEAVRLNLRGQLSKEDLDQVLIKRAIDFTQAPQIVDAARPLLSEDEIRQTFLRGIIDRPKHDALLSQHGFTPETIDRKVRLYYLIPGPADLIHMGIRNVFNPEIVERFQLAGDYPEGFKRAAAQQGISNDWALKYWEAHWIIPGTDQGFEMFQRVTDDRGDPQADTLTLLDGTKVQNIIGRDTLALFLRDKDTPPYYRDKLTEIAYRPLNRIDVRRMFSVGSLTKAGVERAYLNLGYAPPNARLLADFVEKFYAQARKDKSAPIIDGLRREILRLYEQDKLDLSDAAFALADLNFTDKEADLFLAEVDLIKKAQDAEQIESGVGRLFTAQFIDEQEARKRLGAFNVPQAAIERLVSKWRLSLEYRQDTEHFHKARDLTKSEVVEAYVDGLMTRDVAEAFVELLGYPPNEAEILLSLADYRQTKATRTAMTDAIKALYVSGIRDELTTSNDLDTLALPTQRRDALIAEWTLLRETRTEKIPIATLRDMLKAQFFDRNQTFAHLKRHRYTDSDANAILDFWLQQKPKGGGLFGTITGG